MHARGVRRRGTRFRVIAIALAGNVSDFVPQLAPGIINHPLACITASWLYCSSDGTPGKKKTREGQHKLEPGSGVWMNCATTRPYFRFIRPCPLFFIRVLAPAFVAVVSTACARQPNSRDLIWITNDRRAWGTNYYSSIYFSQRVNVYSWVE